MDMLIKNCRLVSPDRDEFPAYIAIREGTIREVSAQDNPLPFANSVYDAEECMALPGFIDLHVHGCAGFDVMEGTLESIKGMARAKLSEGVTAFCPTTLTLPEAELQRALHAVEAYKQHPAYAAVPGVHIEGPFIDPDCAGAQNPAYIRLPDLEEVLRLHSISSVAIVSFAVELEGGIQLARDLIARGMVPACGHSAARYADFERARDAGLGHLTHFCNQMTPLHHRDIGLVGAGLLDDAVSVELICDKVHLCAEMIALVFKVKPIAKICLVTDAISAAGLADGEYTLGGLAIAVSHGIARLADAPESLAGSTLSMNQALKNVRDISNLPMKELVKTVSLNPAKVIGLEKHGKLEVGYAGDVVIMDDDFNIHAVFIKGVQKL
ncbi:MAG: N-acetylglucosamine-6-phosphate deacetylase [Planctomycetota bacterium]